jgi:predicted transcriptional regulator
MNTTSKRLTNQNKVLEAIQANPFKTLSVQSIIRQTGFNKDIVNDNLRNLKEKGIVANYRIGKAAYYRIVTEN